MAFAPTVTVIGNLVADPEVRFLSSGAAVCSMRLANTPSKKVTAPDGSVTWEDEGTLWLRLTAWRQLGENCAESLKRGMEVIVQGRLKQRDWVTQEGEKRISIEMDVDAIGPSLRNATATVNKATRLGANTSQAQDPWTGAAPSNGQAAPSWQEEPPI
jgi:single-strand DNA-binding protein